MEAKMPATYDIGMGYGMAKKQKPLDLTTFLATADGADGRDDRTRPRVSFHEKVQ
jgi:hypothetical protein